MFLTTEDTPWHKILQAPHLQVILTVMLCYFVSAMQAGVVLYRRKVYAYQILGKVLRSTICFGILSGVVLELGRFMDAWSYFYLTFLGLLFISLSVFRILMRWGLKDTVRKVVTCAMWCWWVVRKTTANCIMN